MFISDDFQCTSDCEYYEESDGERWLIFRIKELLDKYILPPAITKKLIHMLPEDLEDIREAYKWKTENGFESNLEKGLDNNDQKLLYSIKKKQTVMIMNCSGNKFRDAKTGKFISKSDLVR